MFREFDLQFASFDTLHQFDELESIDYKAATAPPFHDVPAGATGMEL